MININYRVEELLKKVVIMSRSMKVSPKYITQVKAAMKRSGYPSQQALATELGFSRPTVNNFLNGKPIDYLNFVEISEKLNLNWQEIVSLEDFADNIPSPTPTFTHTQYNWGDAPDISFFCGRETEKNILEKWIVLDNSRLVVLLGMGGIGKTALSVHIARKISDKFEYIIWRSLRNAPPITDILTILIRFLSNQQEIDLPQSLDNQISKLIEYLRNYRCLIILDNAESIMYNSENGQYREGYQGYGELIKRLGETLHRSCLLLTSREKPRELAILEGDTLPVRSLPLKGLQNSECEAIFKSTGVFLSTTDSQNKELINRCGGNPLILKIIANNIKDIFDGNIEEFLRQNTLAFDDIRSLLDEQFNPLSELEKQVMYWLAIEREPISTQELRDNIIPSVSPIKLLEALKSLGNRSLIEKSAGSFTQQPVVMEYILDRLIEHISQEINNFQIELLNSVALLKATSKDYIRETQKNLILQPIAANLFRNFGTLNKIELQLQKFLAYWQNNSPNKLGYMAGNIINLFVYLNIDLTRYNFTNLTICQAFLRDINLHECNFSHTNLAKSIFTETMASIFSVAFSPDGKLIATGDESGQAYLWQVANSQKLFSYKGHIRVIRSIAFSPDGQILATGSDDSLIKFWHINDDKYDGKCFKVLSQHKHWIQSIAFSPDGKILASASSDNTIKLWDVSTGECQLSLTGHSVYLQAVAFSPDGKLLASSSSDRSIRFWDIHNGNCLNILIQHEHPVYTIAFSPDGQILASGSGDKTIKLWDIQDINNISCLAVLAEHKNSVSSVIFSPDGKQIASGSYDRTIKLWDIQDLNNIQCLITWRGHTNWVRSIAFSPDGQTLVSGSTDQTVKLWDVKDITDGKCLATWQGKNDWIRSVAFSSSNNNLLASSSNDKVIRLWDISNSKCIGNFYGHQDVVFAVAFSPDGKILASASYDYTVKLWDVTNHKCLTTLLGHTYRVYSIAFSPDGKILASGSRDRTIKLWDINNNQCLATLQGHTDRVCQVTFSPDGKILASSSYDCTIKLWDVSKRECLATLLGHEREINAIAFRPDGKVLVSGSDDNTLRLWDMNTYQCLKILTSHNNWIFSVAYSPDGQFFASGSGDKTVRLWDAINYECLAILSGHDNWVHSVAFSADSLTLASGSGDKTIKLWDVQTKNCLKTLLPPRPYEGMDITDATGLTAATKATLLALGAVEYQEEKEFEYESH